jgi:hypothetical protein
MKKKKLAKNNDFKIEKKWNNNFGVKKKFSTILREKLVAKSFNH